MSGDSTEQFSDLSRPEHRFTDDVHGEILLNTLERDCVDSPEYRRLFRISQLGLSASFIRQRTIRVVPITENLANWLLDHLETEGNVVPFANISKQLGWLVRNTNAASKKAAEAEGKEARLLKWKKNALRHSFISLSNGGRSGCHPQQPEPVKG